MAFQVTKTLRITLIAVVLTILISEVRLFYEPPQEPFCIQARYDWSLGNGYESDCLATGGNWNNISEWEGYCDYYRLLPGLTEEQCVGPFSDLQVPRYWDGENCRYTPVLSILNQTECLNRLGMWKNDYSGEGYCVLDRWCEDRYDVAYAEWDRKVNLIIVAIGLLVILAGRRYLQAGTARSGIIYGGALAASSGAVFYLASNPFIFVLVILALLLWALIWAANSADKQEMAKKPAKKR